MILIGNEIPIHAINERFPGLQSYSGKGLFLVFISTFMYGSGDGLADDWEGWLADVCALALFVKGVFCLLLCLLRGIYMSYESFSLPLFLAPFLTYMLPGVGMEATTAARHSARHAFRPRRSRSRALWVACEAGYTGATTF